METRRIKALLNDFGYELIDYDWLEGKRVNHCKAWNIGVEVMNKATGEVFKCNGLKSYYTLVAVHIGETTLTGRYSMTTWQHLRKWCEMNGYDYYKRVLDY